MRCALDVVRKNPHNFGWLSKLIHSAAFVLGAILTSITKVPVLVVKQVFVVTKITGMSGRTSAHPGLRAALWVWGTSLCAIQV